MNQLFKVKTEINYQCNPNTRSRNFGMRHPNSKLYKL